MMIMTTAMATEMVMNGINAVTNHNTNNINNNKKNNDINDINNNDGFRHRLHQKQQRQLLIKQQGHHHLPFIPSVLGAAVIEGNPSCIDYNDGSV